ncbi:MAG TPA: SpoIIE family protein phosphatase [Thermosynechococcaceae cyanobacterium]
MTTVLIIDDDLPTQVILQRALAGQDYDVVVARDGVEGLEMAKALHPALIICDWIMPRLDGLEVCRQIKADPNLCTSFFVLLTSRTAVEDRVLGLDNGADDFLSKPIEVNELQARVRAGLRLQRVNQDLQTQKQMLEKELVEAAEYVRSLLPQDCTEGGVQMESRFVPSRQLGGDCFDYFWLDPDYLVVYLLDVSGHGLGSALPSISVLNMLRSQSMDGVNFYQPSHVLYALNETFQMDYQNDKYFTIWYGVYNRVKRQLIYSSAGHPPAVLLTQSLTDDRAAIQLKTSSPPIGMLPDTRFSDQRCTIEELSTLYVFSDGVYEILRSDGTVWGLDAFVQLLMDDRAIIQQKGLDHVLNHVQRLSLNDALDDDLSVLRISFA